ncbi:hypothetical protein KCU65_g10070, partial [Aureobasidium melanogenum]
MRLLDLAPLLPISIALTYVAFVAFGWEQTLARRIQAHNKKDKKLLLPVDVADTKAQESQSWTSHILSAAVPMAHHYVTTTKLWSMEKSEKISVNVCLCQIAIVMAEFGIHYFRYHDSKLDGLLALGAAWGAMTLRTLSLVSDTKWTNLTTSACIAMLGIVSILPESPAPNRGSSRSSSRGMGKSEKADALDTKVKRSRSSGVAYHIFSVSLLLVYLLHDYPSLSDQLFYVFPWSSSISHYLLVFALLFSREGVSNWQATSQNQQTWMQHFQDFLIHAYEGVPDFVRGGVLVPISIMGFWFGLFFLANFMTSCLGFRRLILDEPRTRPKFMDGGVFGAMLYQISAALLVASALPDLKPQELPAVDRVLDFLGIRIANSDSSPTAKTRLCISTAQACDDAPVKATDDDQARNNATEEGATSVEFDLDARRWKLKSATANCDDNNDNDTSRAQSPSPCPPSASISAPLTLPDVSSSKSKEQDATDWTVHIPDSEHNRFLINTRWDKTELGPIRSWPLVLQLMVLKMLGDPRPANLYWGNSRIAIYNEAFAVIAHSRHPAMMGSTAEEAMPATWPFLKIMTQQVQDTKKAFHMPEFEMEVHKESGFLEEAWYDGVFSPILDCDGSFQGLYNSGYEITNSVLLHRYGRLTHQIAAVPAFHNTNVWSHIVEGCQSFERDVPMLLVYSADLVLSQRSEHCTLRLEGSLGINDEHEQTLRHVDIDDSAHPLAPAFRSSKALDHPIVLDTSNDTLTQFRDKVEWRGWPEPSSLVIVMPIFTNGLITGFIVMGLNPRRPYDDDLKKLVNDIWLAEITNVGIYSSSTTGILTYANPQYHEIVDGTSETGKRHAFGLETFVLEEDQDKITTAVERCITQRTNISISVRLKRKWTPPGPSSDQHLWVLNSIVPDIEDDKVQGVIGSLADIRHTMWALQLQKDSTDAALESKKHLERFIDMTSHEMRNPLGATMQCADDILRLIEDNEASPTASVSREMFDSIRENAKTIAFCSAHQKTIADDILVVSKLSSSLLSLASAVCQPELVAKQVVRMFQAEAANADIDLNLEIHRSYAINWA